MAQSHLKKGSAQGAKTSQFPANIKNKIDPAIAGPAYPKPGGNAAKEVISDVGPLAAQSVERGGSWGNRLAAWTIHIGIIHR